MTKNIFDAFKDSILGLQHHYDKIQHYIPKDHNEFVNNFIGFIATINDFCGAYVPLFVWNAMEIVSGFFVFILCIIIRVKLVSMSSNIKKNNTLWIVVKIGQLGLYINCIMAMCVFVDGIYNYLLDEERISLSIVMFSVMLINFNIVYVFYRTDVLDKIKYKV
jgi:hypothetical protein